MLLSTFYFFSKQRMYILLLHEARLQEIIRLHNSVAILLLLPYISSNTRSMMNVYTGKIQILNELIHLLFLVS